MDINGKLIKILPVASGESARGKWVRAGFVIETEEAFPKQVAFTCFGEDKVNMVNPQMLNTMITVSFAPESREFNDRWYTDLRCFRVMPMNAAPQPPVPQGPSNFTAPQPPAADFAQVPQAPMPPAMNNTMDDSGDGLPF